MSDDRPSNKRATTEPLVEVDPWWTEGLEDESFDIPDDDHQWGASFGW
jgi:hypothetical protein